jgi:transposase
VGPITALTLAIEIDPQAFESVRHLAAWAGLTPKEHSTGGKQRMGGITRAGIPSPEESQDLRRLV